MHAVCRNLRNPLHPKCEMVTFISPRRMHRPLTPTSDQPSALFSNRNTCFSFKYYQKQFPIIGNNKNKFPIVLGHQLNITGRQNGKSITISVYLCGRVKVTVRSRRGRSETSTRIDDIRIKFYTEPNTHTKRFAVTVCFTLQIGVGHIFVRFDSG